MKCFWIVGLLSSALLATQPMFASDSICRYIGHYNTRTNTYEGPTWCADIQAQNITVRGPLTTSNAVLTGTSTVSSMIHATETKFTAIEMTNNHSPEKIYLKNNSIVSGNIVFRGLKGVVYKDASSTISGNVIHADVINQ